MKSLLFRINIGFLLSTVTGLVTVEVQANDGPYAWIHELIQKEQRVTVQLQIPVSGDDDINDPYTLQRTSGDEQILLIENHYFSESDAVATEKGCDLFYLKPDLCSDNPSSCIDCNEDGVPECYFGGDSDGFTSTSLPWKDNLKLPVCYSYYLMELIDECVPPGIAEYVFLPINPEPATLTTIDVIDAGKDCSDGGTDADIDTDADTDSNPDTDTAVDSDTETEIDTDANSDSDSNSGCSIRQGGTNSEVTLIKRLIAMLWKS